jgi:ABC-type glycerol-3-phosphate transport system substrate-binding protein
MMLFKRRYSIAVLAVLVALVSAIPLVGLQAQGSANNVVLSIVVPEYMGDAFAPETFTKFEEANPGVKVNVIKSGNDIYFTPAAYELEAYFKGAEKYAALADVLYVGGYNLSPEATRAGYFLDLAPLVTGDSTLNTDDFIPGAWQAFQWDKGIWGLPVTFDITLLTYDPVAFDQAGVAYPSEKWTLDEFANAIRTLTKKDANGKVTIPGIMAYNPGVLFASLSGEKFYDNNVLPNPPQLNKPTLEPLVDTWAKLMSEGILNGPSGDVYDKVPMRMDGTWGLSSNQGPDRKPRSGSLLPGGKAGLDAQGFAVSGGTQQPDKAYALVKYLTTNARVTNRIFGYSPARKSMVGVKDTDLQGGFFASQNFSPEAKALIEKALAVALPPSELRYSTYLDKAISRVNDEKDKLDAKTALQKAQEDATAALKAAEERRSKPVVVSTPIPTPVLAANEVSIKFNLMANVSPVPNKEQWDKAAKDFVDSDPQVGQLVLDTGLGGGPDFLDKFDCYYLSYNRVAGGDTKNLLPLDPFLDTDAAFDKSDVVGGALAQLQKNNKTWGYPLVIQTQVLSYNSQTFTTNNVPEPKNNWTIDAFNNALKALKTNASDPEPFVPRGYGGTYLIALVAAYGGLPLDYRTNPPMINFTDPATAEAIRQYSISTRTSTSNTRNSVERVAAVLGVARRTRPRSTRTF